jgi:hypothetical protein
VSDIKPYAVGLVCASVCAPKDTPIEEIERVVSGQHPTGLDHGWQKSKDSFRTGDPNPCPCNDDPERLHWLLNC